jgi:GAF domain-containing protein/HAMP domain-containing protein
MKKRKFTIAGKIFAGFVVLMFIFLVNAVVFFFTSKQIKDTLHTNSEQNSPSREGVKDFIQLVTKNRMFATNWTYLSKNEEDKKMLFQLKDIDFPQLKNKLIILKKNWVASEIQMLDSAFTNFEALLKLEQETIITKLNNFDAYEDAMVKFEAEATIENEVIPKSDKIIAMLEQIETRKTKQSLESEAALMQSVERANLLNLVLLGLVVVSSFVISFLTSRAITRPVKYLKEVIEQMSVGKLPDFSQNKKTNDEIGDMAIAVETLTAGLKNTSAFAENIGKGNYNADFEALSQDDVLGNALLTMRTNLEQVAANNRQRAWANEGIAKFSEILRNYTDDITQLCDEIITQLVKYTSSNQGAVFVLNDAISDESYLEMLSCYAWDRKKYLNQKISIGEGLVGQAWQEKDTLYISDVPDHFITISSSLGEANPTNILIVPMIFNEKVQGIIEIASLEMYAPHQIAFVQRIAESIASTISNVKINESTQQLLEQSQQMTEEMQAQEEEMRQNMEELEATQEEMRRNEQSYIDEIEQLRKQLVVSNQ